MDAPVDRPRLRYQETAQARSTRTIVRLVFIVYWLLIFEGVLRKWVLPQLSQVLFFIRDPFVLAIYFYALRAGRLQGAPVFAACGILGLLFVFLGGVQIMTMQMSPLVVAYGWHNYFFYVPLAFVIFTNFERDDVARLFRQILLMAIPLSVLAAFQFFSSPDAFINKAIDQDAKVFEVSDGIVRTYGTFTFTTGQSLYATSIFCITLANLTAPRWGRFAKPAIFAISAASVAATIFLSGSRSAFAGCGISLFILVVAGALFGGETARFRTVILPLALVAVMAASFPLAFPSAFDAISKRQVAATEAEGSAEGRAAGSLIGFVDVLGSGPWLGRGLGYGTGGGSTIAGGFASFTLAEDELSRIILEVGPLFGLLYIAMRLGVFAYVVARASDGLQRAGDPLAAAQVGFVGWLLTVGQSTSVGTAMGYAWLFAGFCLAASKTARPLHRVASPHGSSTEAATPIDFDRSLASK